MEQLRLFVPRREDLWFRQRMMADPITMGYNAGYDVSFSGYHQDTGCIDFPETAWADWFGDWIGREPERFFAYLRRESDGAFVGWAHYRWFPPREWWDIGILVSAKERGKGCGRMGLRLLLDRAFRVDGVARLHNGFERSRAAAMKIHREAGFREIGEEDGVLQLLLTREEYEAGRKA